MTFISFLFVFGLTAIPIRMLNLKLDPINERASRHQFYLVARLIRAIHSIESILSKLNINDFICLNLNERTRRPETKDRDRS